MLRLSCIIALCLASLPACTDFDSGGVQGDHYQFVLSRTNMPTTTAEVASLGFDIDGDSATIDNKVGDGLTSLPGIGGLSNLALDGALARGTAILLVDLQTRSLSNASDVGISFYLGQDPSNPPCADATDTTCGRHLDGTTQFTISPSSPLDTTLVGEIRDGQLTAGPGRITLELAFVPLLPPIRLELEGVMVDATVSEDGRITGKFGGGFVESQFGINALPAIAGAIDFVVGRDCAGTAPDCCQPGTEGDLLVADLDNVNVNCAVGPIEFGFGVPGRFQADVDLLDSAGLYNPRQDNVTDSLSVGMGFSGIRAAFPQPDGSQP